MLRIHVSRAAVGLNAQVRAVIMLVEVGVMARSSRRSSRTEVAHLNRVTPNGSIP
jgi:hypothetical protein